MPLTIAECDCNLERTQLYRSQFLPCHDLVSFLARFGFWPHLFGGVPTAIMAAVQTLAPSLRPDQSAVPARSVSEKTL